MCIVGYNIEAIATECASKTTALEAFFALGLDKSLPKGSLLIDFYQSYVPATA